MKSIAKKLLINILIILIFMPSVFAGTLSVTIDSPTSGSGYQVGDTFILTATASCSGSGTNCNSASLTASLGSGLSTSSTNPQSCGNIAIGELCTKTYIINADSSGSKAISVSASSANAPPDSTGISVEIATENLCGDKTCQIDESCVNCPADCGVCVQQQYNIITQNPIDNDIIKKGPLLIYVKLFFGNIVVTSADKVEAISPLFGNVELKANFPDTGFYGTNLTIPETAKEGKYTIKITAISSNARDEKTIKITVNPNLTITLDPQLQDSYFMGDRIIFRGIVRDASGIGQENLTLKISMTQAGEKIIQKIIRTGVGGRFEDSYHISFADPDGNWLISITARDEFGNFGGLLHPAKIKIPEGIAYYAINFLSPLSGAIFGKEETVPISVEIKEENSPVNDAYVSFLTPSGDSVNLTEIQNGTYSVDYKISHSDLPGIWKIAVQAVKRQGNITRVGGSSIPIFIKGGAILLETVSPSRETAYTGRNKLEIKAIYSNNEIVTGARVEANIGNETIQLKERKPGVYSAFYDISEEKIGTNSLIISAIDELGNQGIEEAKLFIKKRGLIKYYLVLFYYELLEPYWWIFAAALVAIFLLCLPLIERKILRKKLDVAREQQKLIRAMQIEAEKKYYKERSISKSEFKRLQQDYESRLEKEIEKEKRYDKKLIKIKHFDARKKH